MGIRRLPLAAAAAPAFPCAAGAAVTPWPFRAATAAAAAPTAAAAPPPPTSLGLRRTLAGWLCALCPPFPGPPYLW